MYGIIYKIENIVNGKVYIGQTTKTAEKRFKEHLIYSKKRKYPIHNAIKKHGVENFKTEVIDYGMSREDLDEKEKMYIRFYNSIVPNGYNIQLGGTTAGKFSEETKKKISKKLKGNIPGNTKTYYFTSPDGINIKVFNLSKFCRDNKLSRPAMIQVNKEKYTNHFGWTKWYFKEKYVHNPLQSFDFADPDGNFIRVYSIRGFCRENNLVHSNMVLLHQGKRKSHKGYTKWLG